MTQGYFSDKERPPRPRVVEEINEEVWRAINAEIESRIENGSFGMYFPGSRPDGRGTTGTDGSALPGAFVMFRTSRPKAVKQCRPL